MPFLLLKISVPLEGRRGLKMMKQKSEKTLDQAIEKYLERGFGSMNKNDFEVYVFNHLVGSSMQGLSDNAISRRLRIPESKVKRLRYEADLNYQQDSDEDYKARFYDVLKNRVYKSDASGRIQFSIKDKALRLYLEDRLESMGSFADSSFNSNIVTLTASDLMALLAEFEGKQEIVEAIKRSLKENDEGLPQSAKEKFMDGMEALVRDLGDRVAPHVTNFLINFSKNSK